MPEPIPNASPNTPRRRLAEWPYLVPMGAFMAFIFLGTLHKSLYPWAYIGRTIVVAGLLIWLWPRFARIRWNGWALGVVVGIVGTFQWIGMESLLVYLVGEKGFSLAILQLVSDIHSHYDYPKAFESPWMLWTFLIIRLFGPVLVVPVMEELFWRDWLWRTMATDDEFDRVPIGVYHWKSVWLVPIFFAMVHVQFLTAIVWALLIAWLLLRTKSIGACIIAHAVTNLLLGLWVLATWKWIPKEYVPFGVPHWFFW